MYRRLAAVIIATVSLLCGCNGNNNNNSNNAELRILTHRLPTHATAVQTIMQESGFLDSALPQGTSIEWMQLGSVTAVRDALATSQADIGMIGQTMFISATENNMPLIALSRAKSIPPWLFSAKPGIASLNDIRPDDKIAIATLGGSPHIAFMILCKERLGNARIFENNMMQMTESEILASVEVNDDISVALYSFAPGSELIKSDKLTLMEETVDFMEIDNEYSLFGLLTVANFEFAVENPAIIEAYYAAERETVKFINEHPDEAAAILAGYWEGETQENIEQMLRDNPPEIEISESSYDRLASFMYEIGLLDHEPKKFSELPNYESIPKAP
jgi:NitT/TauT family transport system substrate-binding protein